jgi:arylsulfatase A-like enzyme
VSLAAPAGQPNVVIFLADDLGWGNVGYHGSEGQTPHIDRLAREGVRFEQFYSYPVCSPTRAGLLTGRSPMRYGIVYSVVRPWANYGLPLDEHILPQTFKAAGYQTAITGKWHLGHAHVKQLPHLRGFDHFYGHVNGAIDYYTHEREGGIDWQRNGESVREEGYSTDLLAAEANRFIEGRDRNRPLFLYVPFNAPHGPLQAPPGGLIKKYSKISNERRRTYLAMVEAMDAALGRVLATLEKQGMAENTLVLFLSDNGGPLGQGASNLALRAGKGTTFEGGIRVPALMHWPVGLKGGRSLNQVMTVLDVLPTLAAAAGLRPGNVKPLDGRNMWPAITTGQISPREDLFFAVGPDETLHLGVRRGEWKLVREISKSERNEKNYLFNIADDPNESADLSAKRPDLVKELVAAIEKWQELHPQNPECSSFPHPGWVAPKDWAQAAVR